jgi:hypothetical protein
MGRGRRFDDSLSGIVTSPLRLQTQLYIAVIELINHARTPTILLPLRRMKAVFTARDAANSLVALGCLGQECRGAEPPAIAELEAFEFSTSRHALNCLGMNREHRRSLLRANQRFNFVLGIVGALRWFLGDIHCDSSSLRWLARLRCSLKIARYSARCPILPSYGNESESYSCLLLISLICVPIRLHWNLEQP